MKNSSINNLIIVPGHGVCIVPTEPADDKSWVGIFPGEGSLYTEHIIEGVKQAAEDKTSLLVFSGGQTREAAGPRSEAESYQEIAEHANWWDYAGIHSRTKQEHYARDSFENLLFSIALFKRECGSWPSFVTVTGWIFKTERYQLHRQAIGWPSDNFRYIGVNNPVGENLRKAEEGEKTKVKSVKSDMFLRGSEWVSHRLVRDPFNRQHVYRGIDRHLDEFFNFLNGATYNCVLPWFSTRL
jgi:hypothetical protein